jgi:competence protein ComEA
MTSWLDRYSSPIIIALAALLAAAIVAIVLQQRDEPASLEIAFDEATPGAGGPIEVYITGAVAKPGVYEMAGGDRVVDLLHEAGGAAPDANLEAINLAVRLHDEDQVIVPRVGQPASSSGVVSGVAAAAQALVNINSASAAELDTLPGIGEAYSQRIVDSRTTAGLFRAIDDLLTRDLIPNATYDRIRDLIAVGP